MIIRFKIIVLIPIKESPPKIRINWMR